MLHNAEAYIRYVRITYLHDANARKEVVVLARMVGSQRKSERNWYQSVAYLFSFLIKSLTSHTLSYGTESCIIGCEAKCKYATCGLVLWWLFFFLMPFNRVNSSSVNTDNALQIHQYCPRLKHCPYLHLNTYWLSAAVCIDSGKAMPHVSHKPHCGTGKGNSRIICVYSPRSVFNDKIYGAVCYSCQISALQI